MINRILIATDFSERSARAEFRAAMLCRELGCGTVELCTVQEAGLPDALAHFLNMAEPAAKASITDQTMRELEQRSVRIEKGYGVQCTVTVRFGRPAQELASRAEEMDANLIILGAHGGNCLSDMFLGNTADKLIRVASRPLLIVKNEPQQVYRQVLVPVDFSDDSQIAAQLALKIAPAAAITFLHAFHVWFEGHMHYANVSSKTIQDYRAKARETARLQLNQFIMELGADGRHPARSLVYGSPSRAVREYAEKMKPDLIVMGKHGRSRFEELLVGSVTRDTLDLTDSDILIASAANSA
jgi:nucleotide-binding universal stress UspA family protein